MRKMFVRLFAVSLFVIGGILIGACDKNCTSCSGLTAPTTTLAPQIYAVATATATVNVTCENGTTISVIVYGFGEAYAATYEEAKKLADQRAQVDLESAKAKAVANVTVVCRSVPQQPPAPQPPASTPVPTPTPPTPPPPPPLPPACTYAITTPAVFKYTGGNGSIGVNASRADCQRPEATSGSFWVEVKSWSTDAPGSWTVFFTTAGNGGGRRFTSITFTAPGLNKTVTIEEDPAPGF